MKRDINPNMQEMNKWGHIRKYKKGREEKRENNFFPFVLISQRFRCQMERKFL